MTELQWIECTHEDLELHTRIRPKVFDNYGTDLVAVVEYEVRVLVYWDGLKFRRDNDHGSDFATSNIAESELWFHGHIKWDGCSNNYFANGGYFHACTMREMVRLGVVCERLFLAAKPLFTNVSY